MRTASHPPATARQISLRLPEELLKRLDQEARSRDLDRSQLVRELLEAALSGGIAEQKPWDRVSDLVGRYRDGIPDPGAKHREHLREMIRDRR